LKKHGLRSLDVFSYQQQVKALSGELKLVRARLLKKKLVESLCFIPARAIDHDAEIKKYLKCRKQILDFQCVL
jgi:hypothetical protein